MPVILTCPHDGAQSPAGVQERTREGTPEGCQFTIRSDLQTAFITQSVAEKILDLTGLSPYVVMASFDRKFIDANRARSPVNSAFTDPAAKPFYDEYHSRIAGFVNEIREQNDNRGFLLIYTARLRFGRILRSRDLTPRRYRLRRLDPEDQPGVLRWKPG